MKNIKLSSVVSILATNLNAAGKRLYECSYIWGNYITGSLRTMDRKSVKITTSHET
jgi:Cu/Ag efflux protein CusF